MANLKRLLIAEVKGMTILMFTFLFQYDNINTFLNILLISSG